LKWLGKGGQKETFINTKEVIVTQKWKYREHEGRAGKFRVGDLVTVTSYALTTEQNDRLLTIDHTKLVGLVVEINYHRSNKYPIKVDWINPMYDKIPKNFFFRELKRKRT
jgi:hypothetical protein